MTASGNERRGRGSRRVNEDWQRLTREEWEALPVGTLREIRCADRAYLVVECVGPATWIVQTRSVPFWWLARFPSVARRRRGDDRAV